MMNRNTILMAVIATGLLAIAPARGQHAAPPKVKDATLGKTPNVHVCGRLVLAGQPAPADIATIKKRGIERVITLRTDGEIDWDEAARVKDAGLEFVQVPFRAPQSLSEDVFDRVRKLLNDSPDTPTLLHCGSANRVGAVWLAYRVLDQGVPLDDAVREAKSIGLRSRDYEAKARAYIQRKSRANR